ncbi:MAG TPA: alpha/beta hydrolase [Conexibacter sp.]|nr:alpha/beta hydrolase [Conexibacter sp.]
MLITQTSVTSADGTTIAFDVRGSGPALVLVGGVLDGRAQQEPVADLLASRFTVLNFDRRGHGASGFTGPYAAQREVEDIAAVIAHAGGSALVYATSGCGMIALQAAAQGVPIEKLVLWEPPFVVDDSRPPVPADYRQQLERMLAEDRQGDMVALFMTEAATVPAEFVAGMRQAGFWDEQEQQAHTLVYDAQLMGDFSLPPHFASIGTPTLVLDGGTTPWMTNAADAVSDLLRDAQRRTLAGQMHNVAPDVVAPAIADFLSV